MTIMDEGVVVLLSALVGAVTSLVGVAVARCYERKDERKRRVREQVAVIFGHLFALLHLAQSACWKASHAPDLVDDDLLRAYERQANETWPALAGATAALAGLDLAMLEALRPGLNQVGKVEGQIAKALFRVGVDRQSALDALRERHDAADRLAAKLPVELAEALRRRRDR